MMHVYASWVLRLMLAIAPSSPWRDTYESNATIIAEESERAPLFAGFDGRQKTAALLVAIWFYEATLKPDAIGDHGRSVCGFQIHESVHAHVGFDRTTLLTDFRACTRAALQIAHESFGVCRGRPQEERLAYYATGDASCDAGRVSRIRFYLARKLYREHPPETDHGQERSIESVYPGGG